jgi:hypothetical protein
MPPSVSPRARRLLSSVGYAALVAVVTALGYLTYRAVNEHRISDAATEAENVGGSVPVIDVADFSARREKSSDSERLTISLRVRLTERGPLDCYLFVLARNDRTSPKLWAVWPTQGPGGAVTAGGHFRGNHPASGQPIRLTSSWARISATLPHPPELPPFETVMVYVVSPKGVVLLSRPFAL